jgi:hypothetical protein
MRNLFRTVQLREALGGDPQSRLWELNLGTLTFPTGGDFLSRRVSPVSDACYEAFRDCWDRESLRPLDSVLDDLANEFDVSNQAMRYRLVNLGLIDPT